MKVLFSADWHIKLGQNNVPIDWQINRFRLFFDKIKELSSSVDIHIIGGDIFDRVPTTEEIRLFLEFISSITIPTYIFDGNHEATTKGKTFLTAFEPLSSLNPLVHIVTGITTIENIDVIGYTHLKKFDPKDFSNDILVTHVRGAIPPHVIPEIKLENLSRWKRVFAGDLHSHSNSQLNIVYPGSPMTTSFHRNPTKTGVIIFDSNTIEYEWIPLELPQLIRKIVSKEEEMVPTEFDHTVYVLEGTVEKLSGIKKENPLLDKKVVKRDVEAKLDFSGTDSISSELTLYLKEVEKIKDIEALQKEFHDSIQTAKLG